MGRSADDHDDGLVPMPSPALARSNPPSFPPSQPQRTAKSRGEASAAIPRMLGSQRTYTVGSRGLARYSEERWGICSLSSIDSHNPHVMVEYAAGQDRGQLLDLASHCMRANRFEAPRHLVEEVAALLRLGQVHNPSDTRPHQTPRRRGFLPRPAASTWTTCWVSSTSRSLFACWLTITSASTSTTWWEARVCRPLPQSLAGSARRPTSARPSTTLCLLRECACFDCSRDLEWIRERSTSPRPGPCRTTQVKAKIVNESHRNCTPTYLRRRFVL